MDPEIPFEDEPQLRVKLSDDEVTEAMNRVCAEVGSTKDEWVEAAARRILERVEW